MSLRARLLLAQFPLLAALVVLALTASFATSSLGRSASRILSDNYRSVLAAQRMKGAVERIDSAAMFLVAGRRDRAVAQLASNRRVFEEELSVEEHNLTEPGEADVARRLRQAWTDYIGRVDTFVAAPTPSDQLDEVYFAELEPRFDAVRAAAEEVLAVNQDAMHRKSDAAARSARSFDTLIVAAAILGCLLGALASAVLTTRLLRPLSVLRQTAQRIGEGDVAVRALVHGQDEIAKLAETFNTMASRVESYRKSSLGELIEAQQAMQAAIDSLPDPVIVLSVGDEVLRVNEAAQRLLGVESDSKAGAVLSALAPAVRAAVERVRTHVLGGHGAYVPRGLDEAVHAATREGERHLLARAMPVRSMEGAVVATTIVLQDVSRLVRFDERRNDLVATVAHELRTPLTSMRMAIHLCLDGSVGSLTEKQADLLFAARDDCERLQATVDELLDVSRMQSGTVPLERVPLAAEEVVAAVAEAHRRKADERSVRLAAETLPDVGPLRADRERLVLALGNLVSNAVRHSPEGGEVTVRAKRAGSAVRFEVQDRGRGIAPEHREAIFERHYQIPGTVSGSAGLGLFIAREIVQAHGGQIGVESEVGRGSTFWIEVPAAGDGPAN